MLPCHALPPTDAPRIAVVIVVLAERARPALATLAEHTRALAESFGELQRAVAPAPFEDSPKFARTVPSPFDRAPRVLGRLLRRPWARRPRLRQSARKVGGAPG